MELSFKARVSIGAALILFLALTMKAQRAKVVFRVEGLDQSHPKEVWVQPMVSPHYDFEVHEGQVPQKGDSLVCEQRNTSKVVNGVKFKVLEMDCEGGMKMDLFGIDFSN